MVPTLIDGLTGPDAHVVMIAPHPDDESVAAGGLLQRTYTGGARVTVLLLTDGETNPWPQRVLERRWRLRDDDRARWGRRRREEVVAATAALGLPTEALHPLGWPDMGITLRALDPARASVDELATRLDALRPTVLAFPALPDRHPDHGAAHVLVALALAMLKRQSCTRASTPRTMLTYSVHGPASDADLEVPLCTAERTRKLAALECHRTQLALSRRRMMAYASRSERFTTATLPSCDAPLRSSYCLPWCASGLRASCLELLIVAANGAWRIPLRDAGRDAASPHLERTPDGLVLTMPPRVAAPLYVKLATTLVTPWIFDRWGWIRLG